MNRFKIIGLLTQIEQITSQLYDVFAEKFPEHADEWSSLAKEERSHVLMIRELAGHAATEEFVFLENFTVEDLEHSLGEMRKNLDEARNSDVSIEGALGMALFIETNMLEFPFYELFEPQTAEAKNILDNIVAAERRHKDTISRICSA